jgi:act minimal PKS acyl carrier protein
MSKLTLAELTRIMRECAGEDDTSPLAGDILDTRFDELGYDSIALMETAGRIRTNYGVLIDDDLLADVGTPRRLLELVNQSIEPAA